MQMEEESVCSSLPDITESVTRQPQRDAWTTGDQQAQSDAGTDRLRLSPKAGRDGPREQIAWPVGHMTSAGLLPSYATVQWDMPDPSAETSSPPVTDSGAANEPSCGRVTSPETTSPSLRRSHDASGELLTLEVREEEATQILISNLERTGNGSEPCDAADAQEPPAQEKEDSSHELLDSNDGIPSTVDSEEEEEEEEEGHSATSDPVETVDIIDIFEGIEGSRKEQTPSHNGLETAEESEVGGEGETEEEQSLTNLSCSEQSEEEQSSCLSAVEVPGRPPQTDDTGPTLNPSQVKSIYLAARFKEPRRADPDTLIDPPQHTGGRENTQKPERLQEVPTGRTDECEMCKGAAQTVDPERSDDDDETLMQAADQRTENFQETPEPTEEVEEASCLQDQHCGHMTSQELQSKHSETSHEGKEARGGEDGSAQRGVANGGHPEPPADTAGPLLNGHGVDRESARRLAEKLYKLEGIQRVDVVKHLDKDNDFSRAVGEEYLKFFDFAGLTLNHALRSLLKVVVLIGETQERERVLQHFARRFHQCNPDSFSSSGAVLALTCALMLLNTDLHGQNVGKSMSSSKFVSNLDGMNEGGNFNKELLKSLYNSIKSEPLEWAVDEEELRSSVLMDENVQDVFSPRSQANPFQDLPDDGRAPVVKEGFLQRKLHADVDGKRTVWGKRRWRTFYGVLRGMVLYFQKDDCKRDQLTNEEEVRVHHSLAEQADDYTKKPHVLRLHTADRRVFLLQASSSVEMTSWIGRINLVSALHSSPPFPAAVGSQRRFFRPILPAVHSAHTMERQLKSHSGMLESFKKDLSYLQKNPPEGKKSSKTKELQEHRLRAEYLQHEVCRYETYIQVLAAWRSVKKTDDDLMSTAELMLFDEATCDDSVGEKMNEDGLKKSQSSPSLDMPPPTVIKVKRNISDRRTNRRPAIPQWSKVE